MTTENYDADYMSPQEEHQIRVEQLAADQLAVLKEISSRLDVIKWCAIASAVALAAIAWA